MTRMNSRDSIALATDELGVVDRILKEPSLINDPNFHVVVDRDQITMNHLLLFSRAHVPSMADLDDQGMFSCQIAQFAAESGLTDWCYFERGRSPFCTSMRGPSHAHAHLFNLFSFVPSTLDDLATETSATIYRSLNEALMNLASSRDEYLLFGEGGRWYVADPKGAHLREKRYIRKYLTTKVA